MNSNQILVAPTEPAKLKALGRSSIAPEKYGVDFLWSAAGKLAGVQRKELMDLIASLHDGRLTRELAQMKALDWAGLIIEGRGIWTNDGMLLTSYQKFSRSHLVGLICSLQRRGVVVYQTASIDETFQTVPIMARWTSKQEHGGLQGREAARKDQWGRATNQDYAIYLLTGLPGVGPKLAEAVYTHFGQIPWAWTVDEEELLKVPGIGKERARRMMAALGRKEPGDEQAA